MLSSWKYLSIFQFAKEMPAEVDEGGTDDVDGCSRVEVEARH
jgi:hypothetical protein